MMLFWVYWVKYNILLNVVSPVAYASNVAAGKCKSADDLIFLLVRCDRPSSQLPYDYGLD